MELNEILSRCDHTLLKPECTMQQIRDLCDGAILVVRSGVTPKGLVKHSIQQLERAGCPLLGIVLNRAGGAGDGYYYRKYGGKYYGGKYGDQYYYGKGKQ